MKRMNASEFKARCLKVLDEVERTGEPVLILKRGRIVARVASASVASGPAPWRTLRGKMEIAGDIVSPAVAPEEWDAISGKQP